VTELKIKNDVFPLHLPPKTTDAAQHVDNNNGKIIKKDVARLFHKFLDEFDWVKNPTGKLSAKARRQLFAGFVNTVVKDFDKNHPELVKSTAVQCGMSIAIDGSNLDKVKPPLYTFISIPNLSLLTFAW
jgi:hypothetical protein